MPSKSVKRLSRADLSDATVAALRNRVRRMYELGHSDVMIARCCGFSVDAVAAFKKAARVHPGQWMIFRVPTGRLPRAR